MFSSDYAYVVFSLDDGPHWWSWMLHPEIKHCLVLFQVGEQWFGANKSREGFEILPVENVSDIVKESIVIKSRLVKGKRSLLMLNTCVGYTKAFLGIGNPFILTPYQLYKYLRKRNDRLA